MPVISMPRDRSAMARIPTSAMSRLKASSYQYDAAPIRNRASAAARTVTPSRISRVGVGVRVRGASDPLTPESVAESPSNHRWEPSGSG